MMVMEKAGVKQPRVLLIDTDSQGHISLVTTGRNDYGQDDLAHRSTTGGMAQADTIPPGKPPRG